MKHGKKARERLKARQERYYETFDKTDKGRKKPGSLNPHKSTSIKGRREK